MRENCGSISDQIDRKCENYLRINLIFGEEKVKLAKLDEKPSSNMRRRNTLRNLYIISRHRNPDSCVWILWTETQSEWERKWKRTKRERLWELICKWMLQQPYLWLSDSQCGLAPVLITLHPLHLTQPPRWCHNSRRFTAPSMPLQIETTICKARPRRADKTTNWSHCSRGKKSTSLLVSFSAALHCKAFGAIEKSSLCSLYGANPCFVRFHLLNWGGNWKISPTNI